jgi:hypothetical protein
MLEGVAKSGVVATFTDTDPSPVNDYAVTINWGDLSPLDTTSASVALSGNTYVITASHNFAEETPAGTFNAVTVAIAETNGADNDKATASSATVADNALTATATTISGAEGSATSPSLVATFTDADPHGAASDYSAIINWGDGTHSNGGISSGSGGTFNVNATHVYHREGTFKYTVTILDAGGSSTKALGTAKVSDPPVTATGGFTISATEGMDSSSQTVATFQDPGSIEGLRDYSANINWGDGSTSAGTITFDTKTAIYTVAGHHLYAEEGSSSVNVTIHHKTAPVTQVSSTAMVSDPAPSAAGGFGFTASEGSPSASQTVATFTDPAGSEALSNYSADIKWGDGSTTIGATITSNAGVFAVSGSHTYSEESTYTIGVTIHHDSANDVMVSSTATVPDPAVAAIGNFIVNGIEGSPSTPQTVATFTDPAGSEALSNYSADIGWADGSTSAGTIALNTATDVFTVTGSHTFAEEGTSAISVTIHHDSAPDVTVTSAAQVSDPAVNGSGGKTVTAMEGSNSGSQAVATFTDPGGAEALTDYSATINWGDNSTSSGTITVDSTTGLFTVNGSHTYQEEGSDPITVTIHHDAAPDAVATSTAQVSDAAVVATGGFTLKAGEGASIGVQTVATFTDPGGAESLADYSAMVNWGDSSSSAGTITFNSGSGLFTVSAGHTYAEQGTFSITVTILHDTAPAVTANSSAQIRVRSDLVGLDNGCNQWWLGTSNGSTAFTHTLGTTWSTKVTWVDLVTGDFTGDGRTDIAGRVLQSGEWWVAVSNGSSFTTTRWTTWNPNVTWADVKVGDFTGDGKDDLVGRVAQSGEIWVATSTGSSFTNSKWTTWSPKATWVDTQVADFNGDGKADYISRDLGSGAWWTGVSTGSSFTTSLWSIWSNKVIWVDVQVGDFNGDGKADIAGRVLQSGEWWVGQSTGSSLFTTKWTTWNPNVTWVDVRVGDFNGDGKADIVGRVLESGEWWMGLSTGSSFSSSLWTKWNPNVTWVDIQVGDFNGDGNADITGRVLQSGEWWTGLSTGSSFATSLWDTWNPKAVWVGVHAGDFA